SDRISSNLGGSSLPGDIVSYNPQLYAISYRESSLSLYIDGSDTPTTATKTAENAYGSWVIGSHKSGGSEFINGYIAEIIIYNRLITNAEREDVEDYLSQKWGIELNH